MREIVRSIKLHEKSIEYIDEVFSQYKEVEYDTSKVITNPIVHIYPIEDTYDENGELHGFIDALLVNMDIYDTKNKTFMKIKYRDELLMNETDRPTGIRIFKDGSTMIIMRGKYQFGSGQSVSVYKV